MTDFQTDAHRRVADAFDRVEALTGNPVFISIADRAETIQNINPDLPLAGLTMAVKDNIDVAGLPTTAGCPSFAYTPNKSATVVDRLVNAGVSILGKTNMDQFATGLVGTRSPHGTPVNPTYPDLVPGGSSSGSAVAVASGLVDVALGTDTAGSGRVPAAHNRIVGLKPTKGRLPATGVVPAVQSLDCVSIFSQTVADAWKVLAVAEGHDPEDIFSRPVEPPPVIAPRLRVGVASQPEFDSPVDAAAWVETVEQILEDDSVDVVDVDIDPLVQAGELLYGGPWVAERYVAVGDFLETKPADADPVVSDIILASASLSAVDVFKAEYRLEQFKRTASEIWNAVDVLVVPTIPGVASVAEVDADPVGRNSRLGRYTNWVNLLDQCAVAVPGADRRDGLPFGVTVLGPAWADPSIAKFAATFSKGESVTIQSGSSEDWTEIVVVGAHLSGMPLNWQLKSLGGELVSETMTAPAYRLFALPGGPIKKPGLVHVGDDGSAIEVETWRIPTTTVGRFLEQIPAPLGLGTIELEDGSTTNGFICEPRGVDSATDVTSFGGWRAYIASL